MFWNSKYGQGFSDKPVYSVIFAGLPHPTVQNEPWAREDTEVKWRVLSNSTTRHRSSYKAAPVRENDSEKMK